LRFITRTDQHRTGISNIEQPLCQTNSHVPEA